MAYSEKVDLTVVTIEQGIITLIEADGSFGRYRQSGIEKYATGDMMVRLIRAGLLVPNWKSFPVIPDNYKISFEDPLIQGRAYKSYNPNRKTK